MSHPRRFLLTVGVVALALAAGAAHRGATRLRAAFPAEADQAFLPRPSVLRTLAVGHTEAMADLVFLRTITYYTSEFFGARRYDWFRRHVDAVNALDPYYRTPYLFAARATLYNGNAIGNDDVRLSSHFLEEGLKVFPNDWEMAFALGCNYLFELRPADTHERDAWRRIGGDWVRRAAIDGGGPPWLANLAATIMSQEGQLDAALRYLEEAYLNAEDDKTRDEVGRLLAAKRQSSIEQLAAARKAFTDGWKHTLPYGPAELYVLVGEPPPARLDLGWLVAAPAPGGALLPSAAATAAE
jgi:hypothetical protein